MRETAFERKGFLFNNKKMIVINLTSFSLKNSCPRNLTAITQKGYSFFLRIDIANQPPKSVVKIR